jgi:type I site-specific restriction-modification system R (restriction) subunit
MENRRANHRQPIVTSCEEESSSSSDDGKDNQMDDDSDSDHETLYTDYKSSNRPDDLLDSNADEEDEAYVYKYLRSGVEETVTLRSSKQKIKVLKPRHSDAILSCPCCLEIVCMDCQKHFRYTNQYRAMFVMNVAVRWDQKLRYDDQQQCLVAVVVDENREGVTKQQENDEKSNSTNNMDSEIYYTVCCASCQTFVAALDMRDEVYHFTGCVASS